MIVAGDDVKGRQPGVLYGDGLATFIARLVDPDTAARESKVFLVASTFGAMAFSTFVFDTLDVSVRLARYLLGELTSLSSRAIGFCASLLTCLLAYGGLKLSASTGEGWRAFWTLFGASNQLMAALTLLGVFVWLRKRGQRGHYVLWPMLVVFAVTISAMCLLVLSGVRGVLGADDPLRAILTSSGINAMAGAILLGLAGLYIVESLRALRTAKSQPGGSERLEAPGVAR
jgi:carbon starvation protein